MTKDSGCFPPCLVWLPHRDEAADGNFFNWIPQSQFQLLLFSVTFIIFTTATDITLTMTITYAKTATVLSVENTIMVQCISTTGVKTLLPLNFKPLNPKPLVPLAL